MTETDSRNELRSAALRVVADRAVQYLLQVGEPVKTGQITGAVSQDHPISAKVVRDALTLDGRFVQVDRRWDLAARTMDTRHTLERNIEDFLSAVGRPLSVDTVGVEVAKATGVSPEGATDTVRRLVSKRPRFTMLDEATVAPAGWFLDTSAKTPEDVLFDNFDDESDVSDLRALDAADGAAQLVNAAGRPVSGKALAYLAYERDPANFRASDFQKSLSDAGLVRLSDGTFVTSDLLASFNEQWERIAEEPPVEGAPEEASARSTGEIAITSADLEEIAAIARRTDAFVSSRMLLEQVLEVNPTDKDFGKWETALSESLTKQGDLINVGWDRWRRYETIPTDILDAPDALTFQSYSFHTLEGEELEVEMSEDGLDGNLKELVRQPMAALGGECKAQKDGSARCTVTVLHHESGTLPVAPVAGGTPFFPAEPALLEASVSGPDGRFSLWINNTLGLAFGLADVYKNLPVSGGVFTLRPDKLPGTFRLEISEGLDPVIGLDEARLKELGVIARRPNFGETSTFDLLGEFLERHRKGAEFFTLLAETWMVRRTSAQLVASLLSAYYAFKQNKNGSWSFDPREVDKGFKKAKRKYAK